MSHLLDHLAQAEAGPWPLHDKAVPADAGAEVPTDADAPPLSGRFARWAWIALAAIVAAFGAALLLLPVPTP
jgi:hypothetical protein